MNEAGTLDHPLLNAVPTSFYDDMIRWITEASPPVSTLDILLSLYQERAPYADLLTQYMLLTPQPEKKRLVGKLSDLVKFWRRDGKPLTLEEIASGNFNTDAKSSIRKVAHRILKGIEKQQAQVRFLKEIRILLPHVFLRPLGWQNFFPFVPPIMIQIAEENSGASRNQVPDDFELIAIFLYGNVNKIYIKELFLIAASLMNEGGKERERNSPKSIYTIISTTKILLEFFFSDLGIKSVAGLDPDIQIIKYLYTDTSKHLNSTKLRCYRSYVEGCNAVERWRRAHPKTRTELGSWCLPALKMPIDTTALALQASQETRLKRHGQLDALMPVYLSLLGVVHHRAYVFAEISAAFDRAWLELEERGTGAAAYPFVVSLSDGSATLQFAILAHSGVDRAAAVCEYLGASDASGQGLPLPFFALVQRGWYDKDYRAELEQYGILPGDCDSYTTGLLRPASRANAIYRNEYVQSKKENRKAKIYLSIDALCSAAAFGSLAVMIDYSSPMRIHEVLQIRVELGYIDDENGYTICLVHQKGCKRAKLQGKIIPLEPFVTHFLREAIKMKVKCNGPLREIHMSGGKSFGFSPGLYLFQWNNGPIFERFLSTLARFIAFGLTYQSPSEQFKNMQMHTLRHGNMRGQHALGRSIKKIQRDAGHTRDQLTLYYLGLLNKQQEGIIFEQLSPITMWESMMPNAIKQMRKER